MKKILFIIMSIFMLFSCQKDEDESFPLDNSDFGIEQITINDSTYSLMPNSFLIDKGPNSPLVLVGTSSSSHSLELNYAWMSKTQKLSSAYITNAKGNVGVLNTSTETTRTIILTIYNIFPEAKLTYTISGPR